VARFQSCPYVFYNQITGDRFKDVKAGLKKAVKDAGLTGITWHTFRHTFASRLVQGGSDIVNHQGTAGPCRNQDDNALCPHESRVKTQSREGS